MYTWIEHFENGRMEFHDTVNFVEFVRRLFAENEVPLSESSLNNPKTYNEALIYIMTYCENFTVIQHSSLLK